MNVAKFAVRAIKEWNPLGAEAIVRRDTNKRFRKAWRKKRRGEALTPEEEQIVAQETVRVILPDGTETTRVEPTIKARTSTKLGVGSVATIGLGLLSLIPFYDEANALIVQACQSESGPLVFLGGMAFMAAQNYITARKTKSPIVPGKL